MLSQGVKIATSLHMQGMDVELHLFLIWAVVSVTVGGWVDQRAGVDVWENRKMSKPRRSLY